MKKSITLYKYTDENKIRIMKIFQENNKVYTQYCIKNGKITTSQPKIFENSKTKTGTQLATTFYNNLIKINKLKGYDETLKKQLIISPMRAHKLEDNYHKIKYPCYIQIKYDGFRCIVHFDQNLNKVVLTSKNGKQFHNLEFIESQLDHILQKNKNLYLDGELYITNSKLHNISSLLLSKKKVNTSSIVFNIFDLFITNDLNLTFNQRYHYLKKIFKENKFKRIHLVKVLEVSREKEIEEYNTKIIEEGYEGVIVRNKDGLYKLNGKSYDVLRTKEFKYDNFKIVGATTGVGKYKNSVIFILECLKSKKTFKAVPYGTLKERELMWSKKGDYIGKIVKVKYLDIDKKGCVIRNPLVII